MCSLEAETDAFRILVLSIHIEAPRHYLRDITALALFLSTLMGTFVSEVKRFEEMPTETNNSS